MIRPHAERPDAGIAFAVRALIHLASLFPEALDLRQVGRDVDQVVTLLGKGTKQFWLCDAHTQSPASSSQRSFKTCWEKPGATVYYPPSPPRPHQPPEVVAEAGSCR
jgi:hypothetical protein